MQCALCLEENNEYINTFSETDKQHEIQKVIFTHFKLQIDENSAFVCKSCWRTLNDFHCFYIKILRAHSLYEAEDLKPLIYGNIFDESPISYDELSSQQSLLKCQNEHKEASQKSGAETGEIDALEIEIKVENEDSILNSLEPPESVEKVVNEELSNTNEQFCESEIANCIAIDNGIRVIEVKDSFDRIISENLNLKCSLCNEPQETFAMLTKHFRTQHDRKNVFALCCGKKFRKRALLVDHIRSHWDPSHFRCHFCGKTLSERRSLEMHLRKHQTTSSTEEFYCEFCLKTFKTRWSYSEHRKRHLPKTVSCSECDKKFSAESLMIQHKRTVHFNEKWMICDICGKTIQKQEDFEAHIAEHAGVSKGKIQCDICLAELANKHSVDKHKRRYHHPVNSKPQTCPYCSKISPNMTAYRQHIRIVHEFKRMHQCHVCNKAFKRACALKEHVATHSIGEKLYACAYCPRTFNSNATMYMHRKRDHPVEYANYHKAKASKNSKMKSK